MKGLIIVNTFLRPKESILHAYRLQEEFNAMGVSVRIESDGFIKSGVVGNKTVTDLFDYDFAVYLDKNKYLSEILEKCNIPVFNSHQSIRICDDKGETYIALANNGIKIPDTIFGTLSYMPDDVIGEGFANTIINKLGLPVVVKESYGSRGVGVYLAKDKTELLKLMNDLKNKPHLYQKYIDCEKGVDYRAIVIGGKVVASMRRRNDGDFRSNVARGGVGEMVDLPKEYIETAEKCAKILGLDYCGVDLLKSEDQSPVVCEVNSNAFVTGIEKATGVNVCRIYAKYIVDKINNIKKI